MDERDTNVVKVNETTGNFQAPQNYAQSSGTLGKSTAPTQEPAPKRGHGSDFQIHEHTVNSGEDIATKIMTLSLEKFHAICILSANGIVSKIAIRHAISRGISTYEGVFKIHSLSGSFDPTETGSTQSRRGELTISFKLMDGQIIGGKLAGVLIAASPVQVKVRSFLPPQLKGKDLLDVEDGKDVVVLDAMVD